MKKGEGRESRREESDSALKRTHKCISKIQLRFKKTNLFIKAEYFLVSWLDNNYKCRFFKRKLQGVTAISIVIIELRTYLQFTEFDCF